MASSPKHPTLWIQGTYGLFVFFGIAALWVAVWGVPAPDWPMLGWISRISGYLAALGMCFPFVHILRRMVRHRDLLSSRWWLDAHIASAYLAFFFLLLHCRARAGSTLTIALVALVWLVMLSGVIGLYGRRALYRALHRLVPCEYGLERLEPERVDCLTCAYRLLAESHFSELAKIPHEQKADPPGLAEALGKAIGVQELSEAMKEGCKREPTKSKDYRVWVGARADLGRALRGVLTQPKLRLGGQEISASSRQEQRWRNREGIERHYPGLLRPVPPAIAELYHAALEDCLTLPFTLLPWASGRRVARRLDATRYQHALKIAGGEGDEVFTKELWQLIEKRRLLDLEYRLHAIGRLWLLFHGPPALALLVLMSQHIVMSMIYGGF